MGLFNAGRDVRTINALLTGAEHEARRGGDALPGPEPLLLSALNLADGTAALALGRFGVDGAALHAALERVPASSRLTFGPGEQGVDRAHVPAGVEQSHRCPPVCGHGADGMRQRGRLADRQWISGPLWPGPWPRTSCEPLGH